MNDGEVLQDSPHRRVVRVGETVCRPMFPWSATIHQLLGYLEAAGFPYSPWVLGVDQQGREVLTYLEGESGAAGWSCVVNEAGLIAMGRLLRDYHQAVAGFRPDDGAVWAGFRGPAGHGELVCHGDFGQWNLVWQNDRPVWILDWDYVWPNRAVHDVAYALEYVAPFRDDEECQRSLGYSRPPDRRHRLEVFSEAYGLTSIDGLVDEVLMQQQVVLDRARLLAAEGRQPQVDFDTGGHFDEVARRLRWSREHRELFT